MNNISFHKINNLYVNSLFYLTKIKSSIVNSSTMYHLFLNIKPRYSMSIIDIMLPNYNTTPSNRYFKLNLLLSYEYMKTNIVLDL